MTGTITRIKKALGYYFFITGDDGVEYYTTQRSVISKRAYNLFCWEGNRAEFDVEEAIEEGMRPRAVNVRPDEIIDPNYQLKKQRSKESKENHERNVERKKEQKRKNELIEADRARYREFMGDHLKYTVQFHEGGEWKDFIQDGVRPLFVSNREAKDEAVSYKKVYGGMWRVRKVIV